MSLGCTGRAPSNFLATSWQGDALQVDILSIPPSYSYPAGDLLLSPVRLCKYNDVCAVVGSNDTWSHSHDQISTGMTACGHDTGMAAAIDLARGIEHVLGLPSSAAFPSYKACRAAAGLGGGAGDPGAGGAAGAHGAAPADAAVGRPVHLHRPARIPTASGSGCSSEVPQVPLFHMQPSL